MQALIVRAVINTVQRVRRGQDTPTLLVPQTNVNRSERKFEKHKLLL